MHQLVNDTSSVAFPISDRSLRLFKRPSPFGWELVVVPLFSCWNVCRVVNQLYDLKSTCMLIRYINHVLKSVHLMSRSVTLLALYLILKKLTQLLPMETHAGKEGEAWSWSQLPPVERICSSSARCQVGQRLSAVGVNLFYLRAWQHIIPLHQQ